MSSGIPDRIKNFIFTYVDSIELLEVLLAFQRDPARARDAADLARELRSTNSSVRKRMTFLEASGLIRRVEGSEVSYLYQPASAALGALVDEIAAIYEIRRHKIFELVYSPTKRARDIADAFQLAGARKNGESDE